MTAPIYLGRQYRREHIVAQYAAVQAKRGAEIGVCTGLYSQLVCERVPTLERLFCVDPWAAFHGNRPNGWGRDQRRHDANYADTVVRMRDYPAAQIVRRPSADAAVDIPDGSLDFVYIDGNHHFDFVMQDLIAWSAKVRPGGIVSGDDYYPFQGKGYIERGVMIAVDAYREAHGIGDLYVTANRSKSWYWVQP